jgi:hypothetical protein
VGAALHGPEMVPKKNSKTTYVAVLGLTALNMEETSNCEMLLVAPSQNISEHRFGQAPGNDPAGLSAGRHLQGPGSPEVHYLSQDRNQPERDRTPYCVVTAPDGSQENFTTDEILHIRGLSWDGLCGLDAVQLLQEPLARNRADARDAACAWRAAERHHLG